MQVKFGIHSFHVVTHPIIQKSQIFGEKIGDEAEVVQCPFNRSRITLMSQRQEFILVRILSD